MGPDIIGRIDGALLEDPANGVYSSDRAIFTDAELFALEMEHIFEGNWVYLAHESQIPNKNDYLTTSIGRQPIFIARNKKNELNAFINACSHRGAVLCRFKRANKATFTCTFHGWTFNNSGKLLKVKDPEGAGYPEQFSREGAHDLQKIAKFESYRGFLFGSLNPDVKPLAQHLGEAAKMIDMVVDQSPDGLEVLRGSSSYIYDGNWKLQVENGADGYHVSSVHWNYVALATADPRRWMLRRRWMPATGPSRRVASIRSKTATCCSGRDGPTRRIGPSTRGSTSWRQSTAEPRPNGWSII